MKNKTEVIKVADWNKSQGKPAKPPAKQTTKVAEQLDTTDADDALSCITINSKAEHVEYNTGKGYIEITLKSSKEVYRITAKKVPK
ncbi:hypothetical protein Q4E40_02770 [Pontibacter sp. BT731]|uniref:hypothetical protein n=1 Tax=Pontibacter coccineus TaxID=3063328 RepID=UPI0026E2545E|nr:hypothetical protein [Pontibacter sp. BT731]MDO6389036.1 hypothetical protein [Pontibacter sp. BT731]